MAPYIPWSQLSLRRRKQILARRKLRTWQWKAIRRVCRALVWGSNVSFSLSTLLARWGKQVRTTNVYSRMSVADEISDAFGWHKRKR